MAPGSSNDSSVSDHDSSSDSSDTPAFRQTQRLAAIRGESIPSDMDDDWNRACVIRGIRLDYAFATSRAVANLCARYPDVARARNARLIMSNMIPGSDVMSGVVPQDEESARSSSTPYCIWYPDMASEETYRELARRYPSMRYQVGRACAAAGLDELYRELDLLPDVCIAEEARENKTRGGRAIYDSIMSSRARYAVMDDYSLTVNLVSPRYPAFLNGDTDVLWKLARRRYPSTRGNFALHEETRPCIEEDERMSDGHEEDWLILNADEVRLLYEPLPVDLPTVKKTLLIQMAAFEGNVDRYVRLARRERMSAQEHICVLRGIYHHTMFARFWASEVERNAPRTRRLRNESQLINIKRAVSARRIMMNDFDEFANGWPPGAPMPFMIWWPRRPCDSTLWYLAEKVPQMREQIAIASIICDYPGLYKKVDAPPSSLLWLAARLTPNTDYLKDIEAKAAELNMEFKQTEICYDAEADSLVPDIEPTDDLPPVPLFDCLQCDFGTCGFWAPFDGGVVLAARVERYVWASADTLASV
ncbi:hypothetical protein G6O67_007217 [Ophiocordyceps sinensis]|uniref:Uncharacterized protein n=1 Tax=Ophiocordyceps sinensis TaxID=72228 RepID=A0A8H4LT73_9HYPO|nr:hypothetical protein G6O67_007217 [Ophiocordyceps sinensis]